MYEQEAKPAGAPRPSELRSAAERRWEAARSASVEALSEVDVRVLLHELQVHQIELEMQNEELQRTQVEAQAAREKYSDLFDFAPIGYFLLDPQGRMRELNLAAAALLGSDRAALAQKPLAPFVALADRAAFAAFCQRVLQTEAKQTCEVQFLGAQETLSVLLEGTAAPDPQAAVTFCRVAAIDVTERKQAEEQLRALNGQLEQNTVELTQRAAQLRTLATTLAQAEQGERRRLSKLLHDHLQQLLVAARLKLDSLRRCVQHDETLTRAASETEQLIDECIRDSRSLAVELSPPILHDGGLALGLDWLARHMEQKYGVPIRLTAERQAEPADEGLRIFLFQAVREILFNAAKHAHAQQIQVQMSRPQAESLRIEVRDDGVGCEPAHVHRLHSAAHGLGLFDLRERVECLGGKLEVVTAPGAGMQVTIELPLAELPRTSAPHGTAASSPAASHDAPGLCVLVADDHPVVRRHLVQLLREQSGIGQVLEARDGQEAVTLALRTHPNLVLMDVTMPEMDGIEATRRIKAALPQMPVLALTMHQDAQMVEAMREAGAAAFFTKGGVPDALLGAIQRYASEPGAAPA